MAPKIVLIRHAQGFHNTLSFQDPGLTDLGFQQCKELRSSLLHRFQDVPISNVAVIVSPMLRTLQTATSALDWLVKKGLRFEANADWQENSADACDTGRPVLEFASSFPHVDFSKVDPVWPDKVSPAAKRFAFTRTDVLHRGKLALDALHARSERLVFVVSHSAFLRVGVTGRWFNNADYRIFEFNDGLDDKGRQLLLQDETTEPRGGMGWSLPQLVELGLDLPDADDDE